jgi:mono/diheme cytochrome c family protein
MRLVAVSSAFFVIVLAGIESGCQAQPSQQPAANPPAGEAVAPNPRDELILATAKIGLPPPGISATDLPDPGSPGANLMATHCAQCHDLPSPAMHSATDWPSVVRRMWLRMERLPADRNIQVPDEGGRATMLTYLINNALKVSGSSLPPGRGRAEFALVCSRCHALPDPRVHSAQDWLAVYLRMERNMERMKVSAPTQAQTGEILAYLQNPAPQKH